MGATALESNGKARGGAKKTFCPDFVKFFSKLLKLVPLAEDCYLPDARPPSGFRNGTQAPVILDVTSSNAIMN